MEQQVLGLIKAGRSFSNFAALTGFVDELTDFEHLLFPFLTCVPPWADELYNDGVWWIPVTDPRSLRRDSGGRLDVPYFNCDPGHRLLGSDWIEDAWGEGTGLLLGCK